MSDIPVGGNSQRVRAAVFPASGRARIRTGAVVNSTAGAAGGLRAIDEGSFSSYFEGVSLNRDSLSFMKPSLSASIRFRNALRGSM